MRPRLLEIPLIFRFIQRAAVLLLLIAGGGACAAFTELQEIPARVDDLEVRVAAIEHRQANVEAVLGELSGTSAKRIAGMGADFQTLVSHVQQLRGHLEELEYRLGENSGVAFGELGERIAAIEQRLEAMESYVGVQSDPNDNPPGPGPSNPPRAGGEEQESYRQAMSLFEAGRLDESRVAFTEFHNNYPDGDLSDNALFWIGESYYRQGEFARAGKNYGRVIREHPDGNKVPDAYYKLGLVFYNLKKYDAAKEAFRKVVKDYPNSYVAPLARKKLELINRGNTQ